MVDALDLQPPSDSPLEKLTDKQRKFVEHYCATGGQNATESARRAGYAEGSAGAAATGLLRHEKILKAIKWVAERKMNAGVAVAAQFMMDLVSGELAGPLSERRKAAERLLDFGGLMAIKESKLNIEVSDNRGMKELLGDIYAMIDEIGGKEARMLETKVEKLLPALGVQDGEFVEEDLSEMVI